MIYDSLRDGDEAELSEVLAGSFGFPAPEAAGWFEQAGRENLRVMRDGSQPVAGLIQIPMGHFLLGRAVPTIGVAGVGVALHQRDRQLGKKLMHECVLECAERGIGLSTLYPATQTLYRSVGYERAGKSTELCVPVANLQTSVTPDGLEARPLVDDDAPAVEALYREIAAETHGYLDRGPYVWGRARRPRKRHNRGFGFFDRDALEAYVYVSQTQRESHAVYHDLWASDLCARSARGYAAIFKLLRAQRSVAENLELRGGVGAPFLGLLRENRFEEKSEVDWMVRVARADVALEQRGYPEHLKANVSFALRDAAIPRNEGAWSLAIADGRASVERGGRGEVALDISQLAPLYTGYLPATTMRRLAMIECEARTARLLDEIFASPMPTICDMF